MTRILWLAVLALLAVLVLYPMAALLITGIQAPDGTVTFEHYQRMFQPRYIGVLATTLQYVTLSTLLATLVAVPLAWMVARTDLPGKSFIRICTALTLLTPPFLQAVAYSFALSPNAGYLNVTLNRLFGLPPLDIYSMGGLVFVTVFVTYPPIFLIVDGALRSMDPALEEAAATTGATTRYIMRHVTLPLVLPAVLASVILVAMEIFALFGPAAVIGIPARIIVLTTQIYVLLSSLPFQIEFAAAMSVLFLGITALLLYAQARLVRGRKFTTISGKGIRTTQVRLGRAKPWLFLYGLLVVTLGLLLPVATLLTISVLRAWGQWFSPGNLTLSNYLTVLFVDQNTYRSLGNTLMLGLATAIGAVVLGLVTAFLWTTSPGMRGRALRILTFLPHSVPGVVFTVGVIIAFLSPPLVLYGTFAILVVCYVARFLPLAAQPIASGLRQIDWSLWEAAQVTGATWGTAMVRVLVPLLKLTLLATGSMVFLSAVRELVSALLLYTSGTQTAMVGIWQLWEAGLAEAAVALLMVLFFVVVILYLATRRLVGDRLF